MKQHKLTPSQTRLLNFLKVYQEEHNHAPTYTEMSEFMGLSKSSVQFKLESLTRKKLIEYKKLFIFK